MVTVRKSVSGVEIGNVYGSIEVIGRPFSSGRNTEGRRAYLALCICRKCGELKTFRVGNLRQGNSRGCQECFDREQLKSDGDRRSKSPLHARWVGMRSRCTCPTNDDYRHYGGRGIRVSDEWSTYLAFKEWALANGYRAGMEIDRIDNDGNYAPSNCRWVTRSQNNRNKRNNRMVTAFGETKCLADWIDDQRCQVKKWRIVHDRLSRGWSPEDAMTLGVKSAAVA